MAIDFDGDNLVITLDAPTDGILTIDAEVGLYNAWKDWMLESYANRKYPQAFRTVGGDSLTPGIDAGAYFFIQNNLGWRIRPFEADATVFLTGNLAPEDSTLPIMIPTIGTYTVLVDGLQPITQNVDTIIEQQTTHILNLQYLISTLFKERTAAVGEVFYFDAVGGSDSNDGTTPDKAVKTITKAHDLCVSGRQDTIFAVTKNGAASTTEHVVISKSGIQLYGPGSYYQVIAPTTAAAAITVTGSVCTISNLKVLTQAGATNYAIENHGGANIFEDVVAQGCPGGGIKFFATAVGSRVKNFIGDQNGGHDIDVYSLVSVIDEAKCGFNTSGASVRIRSGALKTQIFRSGIYDNTGNGIQIDAGAAYTYIDSATEVRNNATNDVLDNGSFTRHEWPVRANESTMTAQQATELNDVWRANYYRRKHDKTANTITVYESDKSTPYKVFDADDELTDISPQ